MSYSRLISLTGLLTGGVYALSVFSRPIQVVVSDHIPLSPLILGMFLFFCVGGTIGITLACALAPAGFYRSDEGRAWMREFGRSTNPTRFRLGTAAVAVFLLLVTAAVLIDASSRTRASRPSRIGRRA